MINENLKNLAEELAMKRIGIITLVHVRNLGAGLQAYAMQHLLKGMNCETVFLKCYGRKAAREFFSWDLNMRFPSCLKPRNLSFYLEKIRKFEQSFSKFHEEPLNEQTVKTCHSILIGSDSVWMPKIVTCPMDTAFFGDVHHDNVSAYAPSSGGYRDIAQYSPAQLQALNRLKYITARDENTQKVAQDATGRQVPLVLDPTLLIDWYQVLKLEKLDSRPIPERYLLLYGWFPDEANRAIREYARKNGLKTITVGLLTGGADVRLAVSPLEFIRYLAYAESMVTCMFHGVMLSLAMGKQFRYVAQDPNRDRKVATTMDSLHVDKDCYYWHPDRQELTFGGLDYSEMNAAKEALVADSLARIREMIA